MAILVDFGAPDVSVPAAEPAGRGYAGRHSTGNGAGRAKATPVRTAIDHEHLARYTLGNHDLEIEVLELFAGEAPRTLARLRAAAEADVVPPRDWQLASHTLKGSARAVGAWKVASAAEAAERDSLDERNSLLAHIESLEEAVGEVTRYIVGLKQTAKSHD
ncbi:MAG: Hpt domain-containing protein [Hyphomicrobiaceae bacterium]|nr:Hpt domain-containing protein [Hyphomicrobiaceae bacterium]